MAERETNAGTPSQPCGATSAPAPQASRAGTPQTSERSDRQTLAALGPARIDDGATTLGLHPHQKAVGALTAGFRGLIGTFHDTHLEQKVPPSARRSGGQIRQALQTTSWCGPLGAGPCKPYRHGKFGRDGASTTVQKKALYWSGYPRVCQCQPCPTRQDCSAIAAILERSAPFACSKDRPSKPVRGIKNLMHRLWITLGAGLN